MYSPFGNSGHSPLKIAKVSLNDQSWGPLVGIVREAYRVNETPEVVREHNLKAEPALELVVEGVEPMTAEWHTVASAVAAVDGRGRQVFRPEGWEWEDAVADYEASSDDFQAAEAISRIESAVGDAENVASKARLAAYDHVLEGLRHLEATARESSGRRALRAAISMVETMKAAWKPESEGGASR